jgi:hypothetical protein
MTSKILFQKLMGTHSVATPDPLLIFLSLAHYMETHRRIWDIGGLDMISAGCLKGFPLYIDKY